MEHSFVLLKPSAIVRGLIGEVITRFERKGLKIIALKMVSVTEERAKMLYAIHEGKTFYKDLIEHITSAPVVVLVVEGEDAVRNVRKLIGATDPRNAKPGTIRGDFSLILEKNVIHAADSKEKAQREIEIFFTEDELYTYERSDEEWTC